MGVGRQQRKDERETRVLHAAALIIRYRHYPDIRRRIACRYGVRKSTADKYLREGADLLLEMAGRTREELRGESAGTYSHVIREALQRCGKDDDSVTNYLRTIVVAQKRLDKLFGLEAPVEVNAHGSVTHEHRHVHSLADAVRENEGLRERIREIAFQFRQGARN